MNIAIVGGEYEFAKQFSKTLANKLNLEPIDFKTEFEKVLLSLNCSIFVENEILQVKETQMLQEFCVKKNVVLQVSEDVIFSNGNYKYLNNNFIIYINSKKINNFENNIKKLIKNKINIEINQEKINFNEIINNIRGYYER